MAESLRARLRCWKYNLFPSYRASGGWVTHIAADWREVRLQLPLNLWTRNYVGTTFCGSMYAAVAPWYMAMLIYNLPDCLVWDKTVTMQFKKPGQTTLYAQFTLTEAHIASIRAELETRRKTERTYQIDLADAQGNVHVSFEEVIYIRRKLADGT
jgi:hypothetical protein